MADSDDSFHSASEGEELSTDIKEVKKVVEAPAKTLKPIIEQPRKEEKLDVTGPYDDANQSADWTKKEDLQSSPELLKKDSIGTDGWDDFGEQADTEGDSEIEIEKIEDDESEYFHRQATPASKTTKKDSSEFEKLFNDEASKGLFDWSALTNVVSAVGEGISNVVESGLGIPPPEEAAKLSIAERRKLLEEAQFVKEPEPALSSDEGSGPSPEGSTHHFPMHEPPSHQNSFGGFFGGLVNGSLDVLETIGKKTFETLTVKSDTDKRRFILQPGKDQNLSEILRELKENEDAPPSSPTKMLGYGSPFAKQISFLKEFEDFDGFVHLECFELLSKDYFAEKVANKQFSKFDEQISNFCLEDVSECLTEEFSKEIKKQSNKFKIGYKPIPLINANEELTAELLKRQEDVDKGGDLNSNVDEFHRFAIIALAKLTSKAIECLCRLVQQMIVAQNRPDLDSVFAFSYLICRRLSFFASQYANLLSLAEQNSKVEEIVTNIFFEASNACHYLKKALELARPFFPDDGYLFNPAEVDEVARPQYAKAKAAKVQASTSSSITESNSSENNDWVEW